MYFDYSQCSTGWDASTLVESGAAAVISESWLPIQILRNRCGGRCKMQRQIQILRQLVLDSQYAVDETTVAEAILARATARRAVLGTAFRNDVRRPQVRSFRPSSQARSFRPCNSKRSQDGLLAIAPWRRP